MQGSRELYSVEAVTQALTDRGGPPEIAPRLIEIAQQQQIMPATLKGWITYHIQKEWSPAQFDAWAKKYKATMERLKRGEQTLENR